MKFIPLAMKAVLNTLFFCIYALIAIIIENFLFGLVLNSMGKVVPNSQDPIHMKLALFTLLLIGLFTCIFRKYFYISLSGGIKVSDTQKEKKQKTIKKDIEEIVPEIAQEKKSDDILEIYIDKEIK